ncbi:MAG: valine--tRNA ligase [Scytolyngbya sp. HA4215-MV1]|jgi:valyl-tRNA synthetase|nr:valine--tRNA ligase [Scytolyngbya sp. HA4215-MV1]
MTATIPALPSQYDPTTTEAKWQKFWEENQVFRADPDHPGEPYCIVIPPPNVTGSLHMGHAFEHSLIDVLIRYHRMIGRNTLWLPGTDHASIAVQTLLEKELKAQGKNRYDVGRDAFLERAWQWKEASGGTIVGQLRRLGLSVDWTRERFTMDEGLSSAVLEAFVTLYDEGLIYRGEYLVNWCPASQSAVSDLEVENQEVNGHLWHIRYPLTDGFGAIEVATTRPETMLGDTAVAVNPADDRYKHLIGRTVLLPILNREIPIIADEFVDASFGTGCVKVTPAHDPNDFEMGKRHQLPFINIMNKDGSLNENAGPFQGQDRFVARKNVVDQLASIDALVRVEEYRHTVPYSDRGKAPIEPLLSTQWFVKIRPMADRALEFLDQQTSPVFVPERWTKVYRDWLVSLKDWCISRQLWWGHQIPAWYVVSETGGQLADQTPFVVARNETEAREKAIAQFGEKVDLVQDPDVLDTWFSAGLWPFSTLGWPHQTVDLERYYPTTTLVTGFDIIFFWVARMTMMAGHFTGQMPFQTVYIHGLVRDENNKKMSKSANNGIDPLLLIDRYGTDALRYTLIKEVAGAGQDIRLEYNRKTDESASVEASRNFTNKLWNASRFVLMNLGDYDFLVLTAELEKNLRSSKLRTQNSLELADFWIVSRFHQTVAQTRQHIDQYGLGEAAKGLYEFIWGDFCDWYIELVKSRLQGEDAHSKQAAQQVLAYVLEGILKLLHPFMPHITEEIWQTLVQSGQATLPTDGTTLALQPYPIADRDLINADLEQQFDLLIGTIRTIRNLRADSDIKPGTKISTVLQSESDRECQILTAGAAYIKDLAKVEALTIRPSTPGCTSGTATVDSTFQPDNQRLLVIGGVGLGIIFVIKIIQALLGALDELPLVPGFLQLVGFGYILWFIYRYLLSETTREELYQRYQAIVESSLGQISLATPEPVPQLVASPQPQMAAGVVGTVQVLIPLAGVVDVAALRGKLEKDLAKIEAEVQSLSNRLGNPGFINKAPAEVVQNTRTTLEEAEKQATILRDRLNQL